MIPRNVRVLELSVDHGKTSGVNRHDREFCGEHSVDTHAQILMASAQNNESEHLIHSSDPQHPANLICELCRKFYTLGWVISPPLTSQKPSHTNPRGE